MKKIWKTNFVSRIVLSVMALSLVVASVTGPSTQAQSPVDTVRCSAISAFAGTSLTAIRVGAAAMQNVFELNIKLIQTAWSISDAATDALRSTGQSLFSGSISVIKLLVRNDRQRAAFNTYKTNMLAAFKTRNAAVDSANTAYREDMMALIKTHQEALTALVNDLRTTISAASETAKANCQKGGSAITLAAAVTKAKLTLAQKALAEEVKSINKGLKLWSDRNKAIFSANGTFVKTANDLTKSLKSALRGK